VGILFSPAGSARRRQWWALVVGALLCALLWPYPSERLDSKHLASTRVVDRNGRLLHERRSADGGYGEWISLDSVSRHVVAATLSAEDANFRRHPGIDPIGVARALWLNARAGRFAYGGSTITQQLAKTLHPEPRTFSGKLREARDALRLDVTLSKDEILEQYLNRVYYGRLAYGIEAASRRFFGKSAAHLELDEAATLAILPRAPTAYDPVRFPERAERRRAHVLSRLAERGWVTHAEAERAAARPIRLVPARNPALSRHVLDALANGSRASGATIVTTIDWDLEERLRLRVREHLADLGRKNVDQAAVVVLDNASGDVLAMLGSRDYEELDAQGAVNATLARRPPGSTLKPFVYALALERGAHALTPVFDVPTSWAGFRPRNADLEHSGLVRLREALGSSLNVPAVRAADEVGIESVAALLRELGLGESIDVSRQGLALSLGAAPVRLVDLANAYATLARGGEHVPWRLTEPHRAPVARRRLIAPAAAFSLSKMLADATARRREFGVETPLELPFVAAVKTGTSKSFCDNVVVGYTPEVTVAVWVGNFDGRPMHGLLAMQGAAPLWRDAMLVAMEERPQRSFEPPPDVETAEVCPTSGMRRGPHCGAGRHVHVSRSHRPVAACTWHGAGGVLRVPAELVSFAPDSAGVLAAGGPELRIANPVDGAHILIDPLIPRSRQALRLRALVSSAHAARVRWEVDGRRIAERAAPFSTEWRIEPGEHRVRASAVRSSGEVVAVHEVRVVVEEG
jgi:penicillin-binding protein 1C